MGAAPSPIASLLPALMLLDIMAAVASVARLDGGGPPARTRLGRHGAEAIGAAVGQEYSALQRTSIQWKIVSMT